MSVFVRVGVGLLSVVVCVGRCLFSLGLVVVEIVDVLFLVGGFWGVLGWR